MEGGWPPVRPRRCVYLSLKTTEAHWPADQASPGGLMTRGWGCEPGTVVGTVEGQRLCGKR